MPHVSFNSHPQLTCAVVSPKFCSRGARARGARVPKFVVTKSSRSESSLKLGLQKRIWLKFFATACHSNSNQCFNMRDRPVSTNKNRPYLLQMSNYTVYFNAKRRFWTRASNWSTRSMSIWPFANSRGGTCPSALCLATPLDTVD